MTARAYAAGDETRPLHYEYAVKQGKHVFMEKPVAVDAVVAEQTVAPREVSFQTAASSRLEVESQCDQDSTILPQCGHLAPRAPGKRHAPRRIGPKRSKT